MSTELRDMERPVLLAGTGRSGTTWLGKLLDSSPDLFYKHEPDHQRNFPWFLDLPSRIEPDVDDPDLVRRYSRAFGDAFWHYSAFLHKRPDFPKAFFRPGVWGSLTVSSRVWQKLSRGRTPVVRIPKWAFRADPASVPLVVKTVVSNLRLAWIHRHFPALRTVLIVRHPGGYLHSMIEAHEKHGWPRYGTHERLAATLLPFPRAEHERYAERFESGDDAERELIYWAVANEAPVLELGRSDRLLPVAYDELCEQPMEVMERIFRFLELPVRESTRRFVEASTSADRPGFYGVFKDPRVAANKWRKGLAPEHAELAERYLDGSSLAPLFASVNPVSAAAGGP